MNKIGLYVVDATVDNSTVNDAANLTWRRKALYYDGKLVDKTVQETNNAGLYVKDNKLMLDGNSIARSDEAASMSVDNETVKFGDSVVASNNICVNITLQDYNNLRAGKFVEGYANYSEDTVYFIVTEDRLDEVIEYDENLVKGHKDIIYNSFIPQNLVPISDGSEETINIGGITDLHASESAASLITAKNFTDPRNVPEAVFRPIDVFINDAVGGPVLKVSYYVDTANYDASCPKTEDNGETYNGIGHCIIEDVNGVETPRWVHHLFTTIIENEFGEEIYRRTTYGGCFNVDCILTRRNSNESNGNHITGKTWITLRTIDSEGRESATSFLDIYVKTLITSSKLAELRALTPNRPDAVDGEGKYVMCKQDLVDYRFIVEKDNENNIIDDATEIDCDNTDGVFTFAAAGDDGSGQYDTERLRYYTFKNRNAEEIKRVHGIQDVTQNGNWVSVRCRNNKNNIVDNPEYRTTPVVAKREDIYDNYTGDKRNNFFAGYRNKLALERLMWEKHLLGYTGVVLYNSNQNDVKTIDDDNNTVYLVDHHSVTKSKNLITGIDAWGTSNISNYNSAVYNEITEETINEEKVTYKTYNSSDVEPYDNSDFAIVRSLYILKVVPSNDSSVISNGCPVDRPWKLVYPKTNEEVPYVSIQSNGNYTYKYNPELNSAKCGLEIITDSHGKHVKYYLGTNASYSSLKNGETLMDWISRDGAAIRRDNDNKIKVCWDDTPKSDEVYTPFVASSGKYQPILRLCNWSVIANNNIKTCISSNIFDNVADYPYIYVGTQVRAGDAPRRIRIPDNFTLDLNYCTILPTFSHDFIKQDSFKPCVVSFDCNENTHVKNGKIVGFFSPDIVKEALIHYAITENAVNSEQEGAPTVTFVGSTLCSLTNVQVENMASYDLLGGSVSSWLNSPVSFSDGITILPSSNQSSKVDIGYIDYSGEFESDGSLEEYDTPILPTESQGGHDNPTGSNSVYLATLKDYNSLDVVSTYTRRGFVTNSATMPKNKIAIFFDNGTTSFKGGKFHTHFAHFYKASGTGQNISYQYIKSYKLKQYTRVSVPYGATHMKMSNYIVGTVNNGSVVPVTSGGKIAGIKWSKITVHPYGSSVVVDSCKITRSKAGTIVGPIGSRIFKNTIITGSVESFGSKDWHTYTNAVMHYEETRGWNGPITLQDCQVREEGIFKSKRQLSVSFGDNLNLINCSGFSLSGNPTRFYIENSKMYGFVIILDRSLHNNVKGIIKNTTYVKDHDYCAYNLYEKDGEGNWVYNEQGKRIIRATYYPSLRINYSPEEPTYTYDTNHCEEPLVGNINIEDCILYGTIIDTPVYARSVHLGRGSSQELLGRKVESLVEQHEINT